MYNPVKKIFSLKRKRSLAETPPDMSQGQRGRQLIYVLIFVVGMALPPLTVGVKAVTEKPLPPVIYKSYLSELLSGRARDIVKGQPFALKAPKYGVLTVTPAINRNLQKKAETILLAQKSHRAAVVVVEAETGRVLALAGLNKGRLAPETALAADSPAASLFKMITAAAALEETSLEPGSKLKFAGRPHTLYRYQLRADPRRRQHKITLMKSFADSNNPVFARLGIHQLGGEVLTAYARAMGYDRQLSFELPVAISRLARPESDFQVGELACGYNRKTTISPLHAALIVSVFVNGGRFFEPWVVEKVTSTDRTLYTGYSRVTEPLVSDETCRGMRRLFEATVSQGTARRAFRRLGRDSVLKGLQVGGKTGTLRGPDRRELFEWFAGYARDPHTGRALAVASLVVHGKVRFSNPKSLARKILRAAFKSV